MAPGLELGIFGLRVYECKALPTKLRALKDMSRIVSSKTVNSLKKYWKENHSFCWDLQRFIDEKIIWFPRNIKEAIHILRNPNHSHNIFLKYGFQILVNCTAWLNNPCCLERNSKFFLHLDPCTFYTKGDNHLRYLKKTEIPIET